MNTDKHRFFNKDGQNGQGFFMNSKDNFFIPFIPLIPVKSFSYLRLSVSICG